MREAASGETHGWRLALGRNLGESREGGPGRTLGGRLISDRLRTLGGRLALEETLGGRLPPGRNFRGKGGSMEAGSKEDPWRHGGSGEDPWR